MSSTGASWGCQGLSVRYGATVALEDVSFEARAGTVAAVVGGAPPESTVAAAAKAIQTQIK